MHTSTRVDRFGAYSCPTHARHMWASTQSTGGQARTGQEGPSGTGPGAVNNHHHHLELPTTSMQWRRTAHRARPRTSGPNWSSTYPGRDGRKEVCSLQPPPSTTNCSAIALRQVTASPICPNTVLVGAMRHAPPVMQRAVWAARMCSPARLVLWGLHWMPSQSSTGLPRQVAIVASNISAMKTALLSAWLVDGSGATPHQQTECNAAECTHIITSLQPINNGQVPDLHQDHSLCQPGWDFNRQPS